MSRSLAKAEAQRKERALGTRPTIKFDCQWPSSVIDKFDRYLKHDLEISAFDRFSRDLKRDHEANLAKQRLEVEHKMLRGDYMVMDDIETIDRRLLGGSFMHGKSRIFSEISLLEMMSKGPIKEAQERRRKLLLLC